MLSIVLVMKAADIASKLWMVKELESGRLSPEFSRNVLDADPTLDAVDQRSRIPRPGSIGFHELNIRLFR